MIKEELSEQLKYVYHSLFLKLKEYRVERYIDEFLFDLFNKISGIARSQFKLKLFQINQIKIWISGLKILSPNAEKLASKFEQECIDGQILCGLKKEDFIFSLNFTIDQYNLMVILLDQYLNYTYPIEISYDSFIFNQRNKSDNMYFEKELNLNSICKELENDLIYGKLIVLGYKEYRVINDCLSPFGFENEYFLLKRRKNPNGLKFFKKNFSLSCQQDPFASYIIFRPELGMNMSKGYHSIQKSSIIYQYNLDSTRDIYQIGRAFESTNDIVLPGPIYFDSQGVQTGPVSRWACRIEFERTPPFKAYLYAGGFNDSHELEVKYTIDHVNERGVFHYKDEVENDRNDEEEEIDSEVSHFKYERSNLYQKEKRIQNTNNSLIDGFTKYGVKLWQPESKQWVEVSVLGDTYFPRANFKDPPALRQRQKLGNRLTNGSIIDICGILLLFQDPVEMACAPKLIPEKVIEELNQMEPHCPILYHEIEFNFVDPRRRATNAITKALLDQVPNLSPFGSLSVPTSDYHSISEEKRSYVFTACGHVFGFHRNLFGKLCPLCRQTGPFVPIAFSFAEGLIDGFPTHVFNPCGHVASEQTCLKWSSLNLFTKNYFSDEKSSICPFCSTSLDPVKPFSKMIFQFKAQESQNLKYLSIQLSSFAKNIQKNKSKKTSDSDLVAEAQAYLIQELHIASTNKL